jgi:hypothetical protein
MGCYKKAVSFRDHCHRLVRLRYIWLSTLCSVDRTSRCICVTKTNLMHYLSSVYFVNQPLYVSGIFVAHHQEVYYIYRYNTYQLLYIYSISPDDGLQICSKHVEFDWRNKLRINSEASGFLLHRWLLSFQKKLLPCLFVSMGVRGKPRMYCSLLAYCTARFGRSNFWPPNALAPTDAFRTLTVEVGTYGRGIRTGNFASMPTSTVHLGIFYMPQICDMGPTALLRFPRKACWGFFSPLKIRRLRPGLNPRTWVPGNCCLHFQDEMKWDVPVNPKWPYLWARLEYYTEDSYTNVILN